MRNYFCGWYFKCQSGTKTLALIPAFHRSDTGNSCSLQVITDSGAWNVVFPYEQFQKEKKGFQIRIGGNTFGTEGIRLSLDTPEISADGAVSFGAFSPIRYDIMGPFRYVPFLECRHSVVSMQHTVNGHFCINGTNYDLKDAVGYIEGDRGRSFPAGYLWTQCCFPEGSLMLSIADIPIGPVRFTGIIGVIHWQGQEYRLATYLGAKAQKISPEEIVVRQGKTVFTVTPAEFRAHPLQAPVQGNMSRIIRESAACRATYRFEKNGCVLFAKESERASLEYEYPSPCYS